jgi:[ribosomal protein S18]-alanine N-acetyltransferase
VSNEIATPGPAESAAEATALRRLVYGDLPAVLAIERRSFQTPWSLAMFVLELSKPSGICLAALEDGVLVGYLVCSRYDTVWHIMNVAVDPGRRRAGIATTLLMRLFERVDDPEAHYTLEVRRSNHGAMELYDRFGFRAAGVRRRYYQDNGEDAVVMWRTPATLRGTLDDVPNASPA